MTTRLTEKALQIAIAAHKEQVRKTDNSPYVVHPIMVGMLLKEHGFSDAVVAAGFMHDVIEDSSITAKQLQAELGAEVAGYVLAVSEDTSLPWEERKELYAQAVADAAEGAKAVCIADKIHNAQSLIAAYQIMGAAVWEVFNRGKAKKIWFEELVYTKVSQTWQHPLLEQYKQVLDVLRTLED